jgi:hypothetical protein
MALVDTASASVVIATGMGKRYTAHMLIKCRSFLVTFIIAATLNEAAAAPAVGASAESYSSASWARRIHNPSFACAPPNRCGDTIRLRVELERYRRMQELREQPAQSDSRTYARDFGPWGQQRYVPPPTPEANIQPAYRDASRLRPEFEPSIQPVDKPDTK